MSYFIELSDYQTYAKDSADFHFIYNANSGGGQSFLGGQYLNENGELSSPTNLDGYVGVFGFLKKGLDGEDKVILLNDKRGKYNIKPRGEGSGSMKLGVGTDKTNPSKLISSFFMIPPTCTIKTPSNLDVSILTTNNYWLHSMWLKCNIINPTSKEVELIPNDFIYCGGESKEKKGTCRYFELKAQKRISDILSLFDNASLLPVELSKNIEVFSNIYLDGKGCHQKDFP